jgi:HEAT repeat protein
MKRITLTVVMLAVAAVAPASATAQDPVRRPVTPPAQPAPAAPVEPTRRPMPAAVAAPRPFDDLFDRSRFELQREAMEAARVDMDMVRENARIATSNVRADMELYRPVMADQIRTQVEMMAPMAATNIYSYGFGGDRIDRMMPPPAWAQGDPADSIYKLARDLVGRGDWGRSARLFNEISTKYSKSAYANDAQYWEAFARYKIGTTDELRQATKILEPLVSRISPNTASTAAAGTPAAVAQRSGSDFRFVYGAGQNRRTNDSDVLGLYLRINGALAQRGDSDAAARVSKYASSQGGPCDQEEITVRTEALNALSQVDPAQALPILRRVIDKKDECSAQLRRSAVFILGRRNDADAAGILMNVAKSDPNTNVRTEAINFLSRIPGDAGVNALEEMLRSEQDERIQRAAVHALMASDNQKARSNMRSLIDRKDAPLNLRIEAISSFNSDRATNDDAAYLRGLYGRADNDRLKESIVSAVSRIGGPENDQWILGIIRNNNEPSSVRSSALSRLSRSPSVSTADLAKLYDASAESYDVRSRIISILGNRKDQEATDKLIEIAKSGTVVNHRVQAINALRDKKDPRATQLLQDILDGKRP